MIRKLEIFAHRGFSAIAPENTLIAFKKALQYDIDGVEFDVQLTKDNKVVVIHDETLNRTTDGKGFVKDYNYAELKKLDAGKWFSDDYAGERIPLLEEVLELFRNREIKINIELKNSLVEYKRLEEKVLKLIKEFNFEYKVIISSFNHYSVKKFNELNRKISTAILGECILFEPGNYMKKLRTKAFHCNKYTINKDIIKYLHDRDYKIRCYTVNDELNFNNMVELNVDGIFTDNPEWSIELRTRTMR